ncbi:hypothetical protein [Pseudomonas chlororaphis]|uniref:hypothetical protein n=1 Tax=Pseudomonas chlororaphis TaxID=587753 RepID=UPI0039E669E1
MYPPNSFMLVHRNACEGCRTMVVVPLQSNPVQGITGYDELDGAYYVIDEIGQALIFESLAVIHAVRVVTEMRLSVVFLYR